MKYLAEETREKLLFAVKKVELSDRYVMGHNARVGKFSAKLMEQLAPERNTELFQEAANFLDVGKSEINAEILNKNGKLTPEEFEEIKKHPVASYQMLLPYVGPEAASFARWHHEKMDGSGYPDQLKGDQIPLESRVMAVADIFDALIATRSYREGFSYESALEIMQKDVDDNKIDAQVFAVLKDMVKKQLLP